MALAAVLGPNQNTLVVATPVFVLQLPALVERVVVGPQREPRTLRRAAQKQSGNSTQHRWIISMTQTTVGAIPV